MRTSRKASKTNKKPPRLDDPRYCRDIYDEEEMNAQTSHRRKPLHKQASGEVFKCKQCRRFVCPLPGGGHHRNHCPFCLYSLHVDERASGDRLSACGCRMEPIGYFQRPKGEYVLVHRCLGCDFERFNRIAADDDFELVLALPRLEARTKREVRVQQLEETLADVEDGWNKRITTEVG